MIQDIYPDRFFNEYRPDAEAHADSPVLCFRGQRVLARLCRKEEGGEILAFPKRSQLGSKPADPDLLYAFAVNETEFFLYIGTPDLRETSLNTEEIQTDLSDGFAYMDIRRLRRGLSNVYGMIVFTGYHLHMWYSGRRFCGACGHRTVHDRTERAVCCPSCGHKNYPRIMPAVIVGVTDGDHLLVTKYKEGYQYYALIAGFTEIGETLEETVAREVMEETGLHVKNIRYYRSQPWGIAGDILAGFYCDVDGDRTITIDAGELKVAEWKHRSGIELQPDGFSLTNEMMKRFKEGRRC